MTTWNLTGTKHHVLICNGSSCMRKGGEETTKAIRDEIANLELDALIHTTRTRCNGRCKEAPVVIAYPEGTWYKEVTPEAGTEIVRQLAKGSIAEKHIMYQYGHEGFAAPANTRHEIGIEKPLNKELQSSKK